MWPPSDRGAPAPCAASSSSITWSRKLARRASESRSGTTAKVSGDAAGAHGGRPSRLRRGIRIVGHRVARDDLAPPRSRARGVAHGRIGAPRPVERGQRLRVRPLALVECVELLRGHLVHAFRIGDDGGAERRPCRLAAAGMLSCELQQGAACRAVVVVVGREVGQQVERLRRARIGGPALGDEAQLRLAFRRAAIAHHRAGDAIPGRRGQRLRLRHLPVLHDRVLVAAQAEQDVRPGDSDPRCCRPPPRTPPRTHPMRGPADPTSPVLRAIVSC